MNILRLIPFLISIYSLGQNSTDQADLTYMQHKLDSLQLNQDEQLEKRLGSSVRKMKLENDSLKTLVKMLKTELLLSQSKLKSKEAKLSKQSGLPHEVYSTETTPNQQDTINTYFVVVNSERSRDGIEEMEAIYNHKFPDQSFMVIQNEKKTWYHLLVDKGYDRTVIGFAVQAYRLKGMNDAWWVKL